MGMWMSVVLAGAVLGLPVTARAGNVEDPFGTRVASYRTEPADSLNARLDRGRAEGAQWTRDPVLIAMHTVPGVLGSEERRSLRVGFEGDGSESPTRGTVTIREDMLMDDSVGAVWHQLRMERTPSGWRVTEHRVAQSCKRGSHTRDFQAAPCP